MEGPVNIIRALLRDIISRRIDVTNMACQQRTKFEGWLKFELAAPLNQQADFTQVALEESYSSGGRSDVSFVYQNIKYFVELMTANTNWLIPFIGIAQIELGNNIDHKARQVLWR